VRLATLCPYQVFPPNALPFEEIYAFGFIRAQGKAG